MTLAQWDDMPDAVRDGTAPARWVELKLRVLVPPDCTYGLRWHWKDGLREMLVEDALQVDMQVHAPLGEAVECKGCGRVAIAFAEDSTPSGRPFPTGLRKHGGGGERGVYCPHCDGAEDIG